MEDKKYLSIDEFRKAANVSKQAIYKQVKNPNSRLAKYILKDGNRTLICIDALAELYKVDFSNSTTSQPISTSKVEYSTQQSTQEVNKIEEETAASQPISTSKVEYSTQEIQPISTDYIEFLKAEIAELKAEKIETENKLNATIKEKDDIIKDQSEQLAQLARQVAQIADKALIATSQQQYLSAMDKTDRAEISEEINEETAPAPREEQHEKKKRSFWSWLFDE